MWYSDEQMVLQMKITMDSTLKQAINANYGNMWDNFMAEVALEMIESLLRRVTNPLVHRKRFDKLIWRKSGLQNSSQEWTYVQKTAISYASLQLNTTSQNNIW